MTSIFELFERLLVQTGINPSNVAPFLSLGASLVGLFIVSRGFLKRVNENESDLEGKWALDDFIRIRTELRDEVQMDLAASSGSKRQYLQNRLDEIESQLATPDAALNAANEAIFELEKMLDRATNEIGGDRVFSAKSAFETGDFSLADDIFSEIEAREATAVETAARAAFGRGEVAETQIRWYDAYTHYKRAVGLDETTEHLKSFARMTWRLAKVDEAVSVYNKLVALAKAEHGAVSPEYATQLNNLAVAVKSGGRYAEAERLFREALTIHSEIIGTMHPDYALDLNNLAGIVQVQGRYSEAEVLYREALFLGQATLDKANPNYARHLNNLAGVMEAQGRYAEAEPLYRETMAIDEATIGKAHPDYATRLNNLGVNAAYQEKYAEASDYLEQALTISKATLPADHPDIASTERSLAVVNAKLP